MNIGMSDGSISIQRNNESRNLLVTVSGIQKVGTSTKLIMNHCQNTLGQILCTLTMKRNCGKEIVLKTEVGNQVKMLYDGRSDISVIHTSASFSFNGNEFDGILSVLNNKQEELEEWKKGVKKIA